jgi:hypothetical protein
MDISPKDTSPKDISRITPDIFQIYDIRCHFYIYYLLSLLGITWNVVGNFYGLKFIKFKTF